jgi:hypothetical protein
MFTSKTSRRAALAAAIAVPAAFLAVATPAFAASGPPVPVAVNASVGSSVSLSGLTAINFGSGIPGATLTYSETYAAQANTPFTVSVQDSGSPAGSLSGPGGALIDDSKITVTPSAVGGEPPFTLSTAPHPTFANGSNNAITDNWALAIPSGQAPGNYTGQVTYTIVSS